MPQINRSALMPFKQKDIFNLVNDVEAYPDFLPWCSSAKIFEKTSDQVLAKLTLKKMGVSYELVTRNRLSPYNLIENEVELLLFRQDQEEIQNHSYSPLKA